MEKSKSSRSSTKKTTKLIVSEVPTILIEEISQKTLIPPKKKKTKKPPVVAAVTPDGIEGSLQPVTERRPLIAHLPIRGHELETDLFANEDEPATPAEKSSLFPYEAQEAFTSIQVVDSMCAGSGPTPVQAPVTIEKKPVIALQHANAEPMPNTSVTTVVTRPALPLHYSEKLMVRFQDANRDQLLPESTDVACFWDCNTFRTKPCVIPSAIEEGIWRVYGNFCCPSCAAAYLFAERLDVHVQWERYALLNRLYAGGITECVPLAPPRFVLRLFGGPMDVVDFRAAVEKKHMRIDVMTPPMISIIQVMDTKPIDFYDSSIKNNFIPWEMDRQNRPGAQGLRLRRTKPIAEKESTLEYCMGIQTVGGN